MESYFCNICNKKYASYQSIWNHNNKFHKATDLINNNISPNTNNILPNTNNILPNDISILPNDISILPNDISILPNNISTIKKIQCPYCNQIFNHRSNKSVHIKICKKKDSKIQIINDRINCIFCGYISNCVSSFYKHRKVCKKKNEKINTINNINNNTINNINNNNTTNNNNCNNTTNNNTINNTINNKYIVNFSDNTDCFRLLSTPQKLQILQQCRQSFEKMIKLTNFNDDYPELQNIYFGDKKSTATGYVFEDSKFIAINKLEVLNDTYNDKITLMSEIINDETIGGDYDRSNFKRFYEELHNTNLKYDHQGKKYKNLRAYIIKKMNIIIYNNSNEKLFNTLQKSNNLKKISMKDFITQIEEKIELEKFQN